MSLICINSSRVVDSSLIQTATRCGNYTQMDMKRQDGTLEWVSVWDEDRALWDAILEAATNQAKAA